MTVAMTGQISEIFTEHFRRNFLIYFLVFLSLIMGVVFGTMVVTRLDSSQRKEVLTYIEDFFRGYDLSKLESREVVARERVVGNLKVLTVAWLLGVSVIGSPLIIISLFVRGFIVGFTVGFLVKELVAKGILIAILSVLPHNLLFLPALGLLSIGAFSFAHTLVRNRYSRHRPLIYQNLLGFTLLAIAMFILGVAAGFVEAYITPVFMGIVSRYLI